MRVQVFGFQTRNSQRYQGKKPNLQGHLLQTHPGIIISSLKNEKPGGQLVPLLHLKTSFLALFNTLSALNTAKKRCLLLIISKNNTCIYNMFYVDSVLTWWVVTMVTCKCFVWPSWHCEFCCETAESWMGCGLAVFLSISTNEIGSKRQLQLQFPWCWWNPTQRYKGAVWLLQLQYVG